jgi:hypothetical protein
MSPLLCLWPTWLLYCLAMLLTLLRTDAKKLLHTTCLYGKAPSSLHTMQHCQIHRNLDDDGF